MRNQDNKIKPIINLDKVFCPKCNTEQPTLKLADNLRQIIKGGWTCNQCGCEMDRFGKEIV